MPFTGSVYALPNPDAFPVSNAVISSTAYKNVLADIATALNSLLLRNGLNSMTGTLSMGNNPINGISSLIATLVSTTSVGTQKITFPGPQVPSAGQRDLDDYFEGGSAVSVPTGNGVTYSTNFGMKYVKVGRIVFLTCDITVPVNVSANPAQLGGLPYTSDVNIGGVLAVGFQNANLSNLACLVQPNLARADFSLADGSLVTNAQLSNKRVIVAGCYLAAT